MQERKEEEKESNNTLSTFLQTNLKLGISKAIAVIPTQPLHVIQKMQQARMLSIPEAYKEILKTESRTAFFQGAGLGVTKELLKSTIYKGALITGAPDLAEMILPTKISKQQYPLTHAIVAGSIAGASDVALGGMLDTVATFQATSQGKHAKASFKDELKAEKTLGGKFRRMYKGAVPATLKTSVAFGTFFYTTKPIKKMVKEIYHLEDYEKSPWYVPFTAALASGAAVATTSSIFDIAKTQAQMPNPNNLPLLQSLTHNYNQYGFRSITTGLPIKFFMVAVGWGINHIVTQKEGANEHENHTHSIKRNKP